MVELRIMGENHSKTNLGLVLGRNNSLKTTIFFSACVILDVNGSVHVPSASIRTKHQESRVGGLLDSQSLVWLLAQSKPLVNVTE